jgi:hypothetical protein
MVSGKNLMRAFASIFRKKRIIFLGKRGMTFFDDERIYFINSEVLDGDVDVIVEDEGMYYVENNKQIMLSEEERNRLLKKVELEMKKIGLVAVLPHRYMKWKESVS